jgi:Ca2+-binding EF-hand superfamily protein
MGGLGGVGYGGLPAYAARQFQQNLFNPIDPGGGDGSVAQTALEAAATKAGSGTQSLDALYSVLDPAGSGGIGEQQFARALPGSGFSDQMQAQMIGYQAQGWPGASAPRPGGQLAQSLFAQIDGNGDGSISKAELEAAVTGAGGSQEGADALFAKLDPDGTGSVSGRQLAKSLFQAMPHHRHHHHPGGATDAVGATDDSSATDGGSAADALTALFNADGGGAGNSPMQIAQNMFAQTAGNGDGAITQAKLEQSVTAAGGGKAGADALFAKLDPTGTGSVSQQQFIDTLKPPSAAGHTAQDALLALLDPAAPNSPNPPATSVGSATGGTPIGTGTTAQDAVMTLINGSGGATNRPAGAATAGMFNSADLARAFSLYQIQLEQRLLSGLGAIQSASA